LAVPSSGLLGFGGTSALKMAAPDMSRYRPRRAAVSRAPETPPEPGAFSPR